MPALSRQRVSQRESMSDWQKQQNAKIKKRRHVIEQFFGTLNSRFRFSRTSYFSKEKSRGAKFAKGNVPQPFKERQ